VRYRYTAPSPAGQQPPLVLVSEAGPGGSWPDRSLTPKGQGCWGVAPSLIPQRPGDRVTTHRRDALTQTRLLRSGDLPPVDVPAVEEEARRDLGRARAEALHDRKPAQCRLQALLLRHASRSPAAPPGGRPTAAGAARSSGPPRRRRVGAKHTSAQSLRPPNGGRVWHTPAETRGRPGAWPRWSTRPRLAAGGPCPVAVTTGAARGALPRFAPPRPLMPSRGFTPSAYATGERRRQGGLTTTGNRQALGAGAWASRSPATVRRPRP